MIKDSYLKLLAIPLLGLLLPMVSGVLSYERYSWPGYLLANLYFILVSFITWKGCNWIHLAIRPIYSPVHHVARRMIAICFTCALYGICIASFSMMGWIQFSTVTTPLDNIIRFILATALAVIVFTLLYEILFMAKEKEQDIRTVDLLNRERSRAELHALQNEMDPHFLFNALNTLNHLILNNARQAHVFNNKLAQVYKYFLLNKNKQLISLEQELGFIDDYFFLLQLRYENKLSLDIRLENAVASDIRIPPCSLQILIENAIKHNAFSEQEPLDIRISINGQYIRVVNKIRPKPYIIDSTQIGLNNLSSRYRILFNKEIIINPGKDNFCVNLPVIK